MTGKPHPRTRTHNHHPVNTKSLPVVMLLNIMLTLAQVAGSFLSGSLALLSGALHSLSNVFSAFHAFVAILAGKKDTHPEKASRLGLAGVFAALLNAVIITILSFFLLREAYHRLYDPAPVRALVMIVVGMIGMLASLYAAGILKNDTRKSSRMKEIYIHHIVNGISSTVVIAGGSLIYFYQVTWIDPLVTGLISLFILRSVFVILVNAGRAVNHSASGQLDLPGLKKTLEQYPGIRHVGHIQAWTRGDRTVYLDAHLEVGQDLKLSELAETREGIEDLLRQDFRIHHITLQFEYGTNHVPGAVEKE